MDTTALFTMNYGLYILGTKCEQQLNACIINTGMQVTAMPEQVSVTVAKSNLTHDLVMASKQFSLTTLIAKQVIENVKHFGMQSGREINKFQDIDYRLDCLGNPYIVEGVAAVITGKVNKTVDVGTHTVFIADVVDAKNFEQNTAITYLEYRALKAKQMPIAQDNKVYECTVCHYEYEGTVPFEELAEDYVCPVCKQPKSAFIFK